MSITTKKTTQNLELILKSLKNIENSQNYIVPGIWAGKSDGNSKGVNPGKFYKGRIKEIIKLAKKRENKQFSHNNAVIYNMFVRYFCTYDHDGNGKIITEPLANGLRETGTFLKAIALLPYIHWLGADIIYLLPVTPVGLDGRKGNLGSPYAARNPIQIDENLGEPALGLTVDVQFAAFIEAAHLLGKKVIHEFVLRTGSIDSTLALEHPEWFYWIDAIIPDRKDGSDGYGSPDFEEDVLKSIKEKVQNDDFETLPEPPEKYRAMFLEPPEKIEIVNNKILGAYSDGKQARIPGAFADWPPDDNQPVWSDVSYLKMYTNPEFNYIAYNTIRMYDKKLLENGEKNQGLWDFIVSIIPYWQVQFGIDGVMIDMGHALPEELRTEIISKARNINPDFIFWEENFILAETAVEEGYNASLGYMCFDQHDVFKLSGLLSDIENNKLPIYFFATPETHNTRRAASREGGIEFSKSAYLLNSLLPELTFICNGFDIGEKNSINTGLGFTNEEIQHFPPEKLPLFSSLSPGWGNGNGISEFISYCSTIRTKHIDNQFESRLINLSRPDDALIALMRETKEGKILLFACNYDKNIKNFELRLPFAIENHKSKIGEYILDSNSLRFNLRSFDRLLILLESGDEN